MCITPSDSIPVLGMCLPSNLKWLTFKRYDVDFGGGLVVRVHSTQCPPCPPPPERVRDFPQAEHVWSPDRPGTQRAPMPTLRANGQYPTCSPPPCAMPGSPQ